MSLRWPVGGPLHRPSRLGRLSRALIIGGALAGMSAARSGAPDPWPAARDLSLAVLPGSVLDFSGMQRLQAIGEADGLTLGADGQFRVASQGGQGEPRHFLIAALGFGLITGGFPNEADANAWVEQVVRRGYTMVRLDFIEDVLMHQREKDFDADPVQLRRLHYLLAKLRQAGVYYILNLMSSGNAGYGGLDERWVDRRGVGVRLYHDPRALDHWVQMVQAFYGAPNPYTGVSILKDPALAGVAVVNEGGLNFAARQQTPLAIEQQFRAWQEARPAGGRSVAAGGTGGADGWQPFVVEREAALIDAQTQALRQMGFRGAITAYNNWLSPAASYSRGHLDWVDMHNYAGEPDHWASKGSTLRSVSPIAQGGGYYLRDLAVSRYWDKAYTTSEIGQVFWDPKRHESTLLVPALAALQGWQGICQHSRAIELRYWAPGVAPLVRPFMVGLDPVSRATEVVAAALYGRGDVDPSPHRVALQIGAEFALQQSQPLSSIHPDWTQLALLTGVGLVPATATASTATQAKPPKADLTIRLRGAPEPSRADAPTLTQAVAQLRRNGVLPVPNQTDVAVGRYQSDTGQLGLDRQAGTFTVQTPRSEGISFTTAGSAAAATGPALPSLKSLKVMSASGPATLALIAVDGQPLAQSKRLLLVVSTDARNTGMRFRDNAAETLEDAGELPVRIRGIALSLQLALGPGAWQAWPVAMNGQRHTPLALRLAAPITTPTPKPTPQPVQLDVDTSQLPDGPVTFFELAAQP
jgi:hypothetical protein